MYSPAHSSVITVFQNAAKRKFTDVSLDCLTLEDETNRLSRNVGSQLLIYAA